MLGFRAKDLGFRLGRVKMCGFRAQGRLGYELASSGLSFTTCCNVSPAVSSWP